eukprot:12935829-Prorocentrum_lima.AAC.1
MCGSQWPEQWGPVFAHCIRQPVLGIEPDSQSQGRGRLPAQGGHSVRRHVLLPSAMQQLAPLLARGG